MTPTELVQQACPKIGTLGAAFYFVPDTLAKGKEMDLDGFRFYFLGRGGVLGDVEPPVVEAAFGYFAPGLVEKIWTSAKAKASPRAAATAYTECAHALGRAKLADMPGLDAYVEAAGAINDAAKADVASLSLYAAHAADPLADDAPARAMQLTALLREFRGSAHLSAHRVLGLSHQVGHAIKRPDDVKTFGYDPAPEVTDADRALHADIEAATDKMVLAAYSAVDVDGANALVAGLDAMETALAG
ncbi:MAG: hypothetical protein AAF467_16130 [Actinomycetota bacterium]